MQYQYLFNNFPFLSISPDFFDLLQSVAKHGSETTEFSQLEKNEVEKGLKIKNIFKNYLIIMTDVSKLFHNWSTFMKQLTFDNLRHEMYLYPPFLPKSELEILASSERIIFTGCMLSHI